LLLQHYGLTAAGMLQRIAQRWPDLPVLATLRRVA